MIEILIGIILTPFAVAALIVTGALVVNTVKIINKK